MKMITTKCDWTARCPCGFLGYHRHEDEALTAIAKEILSHLNWKDLKRLVDLIQSLLSCKFFRAKLVKLPRLLGCKVSVPLRYCHLDLTATIPYAGDSVFPMFNVLVTPSSRGTIRLSSSFPFDPPLIDPAVFSTELGSKLTYAWARMTSTAIQNIHAAQNSESLNMGFLKRYAAMYRMRR
jgi:hypothetical protein